MSDQSKPKDIRPRAMALVAGATAGVLVAPFLMRQEGFEWWAVPVGGGIAFVIVGALAFFIARNRLSK
jgi:hypothetical protein